MRFFILFLLFLAPWPEVSFGQDGPTSDREYIKTVVKEMAKASGYSYASKFDIHELPEKTAAFPNSPLWYSTVEVNVDGKSASETFFFIKINKDKPLYPLFIQSDVSGTLTTIIPVEKTKMMMAERLAAMIVDSVNASNLKTIQKQFGEGEQPIRTWKAKIGSHSTKGRFVEFKDDKIVIEKPPETIEVPISSLSESDQNWLEKLKSKRATGVDK